MEMNSLPFYIGIEAVTTPRSAANEAAKTQNHTYPNTLGFDGRFHVFRTAGDVPTRTMEEW